MFNDSRLLDCVAYGSQFAHEFNTRIVELRSGVERRNSDWSMPRFRYSVIYQNLKEEDHDKVYWAHMASMGAAIPFRFKDWRDFQAVDQVQGVAVDGVQTMQLIKHYSFGSVNFIREITKPIEDSMSLQADGVPISFTVDPLTGLFSFAAAEGQTITASYEFDVPVRFVSDRLASDPVARTSGAGLRLTSDVDLIEVKGE